MKLPEHNSFTHIYYDDRCPRTSSFIQWLDRQAHLCVMHFLSYRSAHAEEWFQSLKDDEPERELIVRSANGDFYRGAKAWVYCLLCTSEYADLGKKLSDPALMPWARKACHIAALEGVAELRDILARNDEVNVVEELRNHYLMDRKVGDFLFDIGRIPDGII